MGLNVLVDSGDQIRDVLEGASTDAPVGNLAEPALHHVQPRAGSGNEMQVEAGMAFQPRLDARMFARPVVVDDQMQVQIECGLDADQLQETDKFLMAMPRHAIANDRPIQHVQMTGIGQKRNASIDLPSAWNRIVQSATINMEVYWKH